MRPALRGALRLLPFAGVLLGVVAAGLGSTPVPELFRHQDKLHHLAGFAALAFTARLAFPRLHAGWLLSGSLLLALLIELGQELIPSRTPSLGDMSANLLGVLLGWFAGRWLPDRPT
ncbi:VanZ family protein [Pseudomonas stutzeri]|nr:VanZ family protein [Stutzerimonas stutzeri]